METIAKKVLEIADPVFGRRKFNYGRNIPWNKLGRTPEYNRTEALANAMGQAAVRFSQAAWELTQALKHVRDAHDMGERGRALAALAQARLANDLLGIDGTMLIRLTPTDTTPILASSNDGEPR